MKTIITISLAIAVVFVSGCGTIEKAADWIKTDHMTSATNAPPAPAAITDAVDIAGARIIGKHRMNPNAAKIVADLVDVKKYVRHKITFNVTPALDWPTVTGDNGKTTDGGVCILWREADGSLTGGFFDHHGLHQTQKGLENVTGGYIDGRQPPDGAETFFYLINYAGTERTTAKPGGSW